MSISDVMEMIFEIVWMKWKTEKEVFYIDINVHTVKTSADVVGIKLRKIEL